MTGRQWTQLVLAWTVGVVVMVVGSRALAAALGVQWQGTWHLVPVFLLAAVIATVLSRRGRGAHKA